MQQILDYIIANIVVITAIQQGLFSTISLIAQLAGLPKVSKLAGTFSTVDLGRIARWIKATTAAKSALKAGVVSLVLLASGCSLFNPRPSTPCPGLYCLSVDIPGVPGSAKLCYDTDEQRAAAKAKLEAEGKKVTVVK